MIGRAEIDDSKIHAASSVFSQAIRRSGADGERKGDVESSSIDACQSFRNRGRLSFLCGSYREIQDGFALAFILG
jgi:hypothetical protein